jgi:hypothetical protein
VAEGARVLPGPDLPVEARAAQDQAGAAIPESLFGNTAEARRQAAAALRVSRGGVGTFGAAFALGLSDDPAHAETPYGPETPMIRNLW